MRNDIRFLDEDEHLFDVAMTVTGMNDRHVSDYSDDLLLDSIECIRAEPEELGPVPLDMAVEAWGRGFFIRA